MITIKGEMADLNAYIKSLNSHYAVGNRVKREQTDLVRWECKRQAIKAVKDYPVRILFKWFSKDQRKDIDNVAFAKKFILDGMVEAGVLENDSRKYVGGFEDDFFIDKVDPRVEIEIEKLST